MTEQSPRPRRRRRPGPLPVVFSSLATFLAVLSLMAAQLHAGHDPALGSGAQVAKAKTHPVTTRTSGGGERDDG
jgi:hypothetical protein